MNGQRGRNFGSVTGLIHGLVELTSAYTVLGESYYDAKDVT